MLCVLRVLPCACCVCCTCAACVLRDGSAGCTFSLGRRSRRPLLAAALAAAAAVLARCDLSTPLPRPNTRPYTHHHGQIRTFHGRFQYLFIESICEQR